MASAAGGRDGSAGGAAARGMASAVGGRDGSRPERLRPTPEVLINRLVLWNIDLTLMDVGRITREAYAEAFRRVTGRPLRQLPQLPGRMESEIFFDALGPQRGRARGRGRRGRAGRSGR